MRAAEENTMTCDCTDRQMIVDVLNRYATCLDARDWPGLDGVFAPEAVGRYGAFVADGRAAIVTAIRRSLDGCGPSQHLLGNYDVSVAADEAETWTKARVIHMGAGTRAALQPYESIGLYHDRLRRGPDGWRIVHRHYDEHLSMGDIDVLQPR
jgi:SnoaL-like domain